MVIHSSTSGIPRDFVAGNGVTSPPPRLTPSRTFRTTRRPDTRVVLGAGLALLSLAALGIGLSQEVPGTQAVLRVTHDLPADAVLQADDINVARVSLPQDVAATTWHCGRRNRDGSLRQRQRCALADQFFDGRVIDAVIVRTLQRLNLLSQRGPLPFIIIDCPLTRRLARIV